MGLSPKVEEDVVYPGQWPQNIENLWAGQRNVIYGCCDTNSQKELFKAGKRKLWQTQGRGYGHCSGALKDAATQGGENNHSSISLAWSQEVNRDLFGEHQAGQS